ncbi:MAG: SulP family inorganic anion transporter [Anaerolineae bacterium]
MSVNQETATKFQWPRLLVGLRGIKRADLPGEIAAGVTLAALVIPLNIGYAQVAGLPAIVGLYAAIVPLAIFALFTTSRQVVGSPDAPIAALVGSVLVTFAMPGDALYVQFALALALMCALFYFIFWYFRLGFLANFLSKAVLVGFITGLGIEVLTSQIEKIMGVHIEAGSYLGEVLALIGSIPQSNWYAVAIGLGTILLIRLMRKYTPKVPGALVALVLMTLVVALFRLDDRGVSVLGDLPSGLPSLTWPGLALADYLRLMPGALAVVGITLAEGLLLVRKYSRAYNYKVNVDQELFAYGVANVAAGLTGSFVMGSSASRTAAMDSAGSRSQLPSLVAAVTVALVLLFFSDLLALLPNAALAGIVANAVLSLIEVEELKELYHLRRSEFAIALVCLASVLALGPLRAVIIAFLLTTIDVVGRASSPRTGVLVAAAGGQDYYMAGAGSNSQTAPGLIIYRFGAPLYFANANLFLEEVETLVSHAPEPVKWFVLDAEAITDIDTTGAEALAQSHSLLTGLGVTLAVSRAKEPVPKLLQRYELFERIGENHLFATNRLAVEACFRDIGQPAPKPATGLNDVAAL